MLIWSMNDAIAQSKAFNYSGTHWEKYNGHKLQIVVLDTSVAGTRLIAEQVIQNGEFNVSGKLANPQNAYFGLYNPEGDFVYKQEFIVEPGSIKIDLDTSTDGIIVKGGKYNPVFEAIKNDPVYLEKEKSLRDFISGIKDGEFKNDSVKKRYMDLYELANNYVTQKYNEIRFHSPDPQARLLAISHSDSRIDYGKELDELQEKLGPLPEIVSLRARLQARKERQENSSAIKIGSIIKDFSAKGIQGNSFHLASVMRKNKFTLVEFWASWCGPCRAEIPHMKEAYQKFRAKGFEIVSFTLDHERNRWEKASTEENLPWINVGDLLAFKSPVVRMFGIGGIPANYLVDSSGKIIAKDLRQENLDKKLEELLSK